jgi:hypothetical protein
VLESLPLHFRVADSEPDVFLIASMASDWLDRLSGAVRRGAKGVLVTGSGTADTDALREAKAAAAVSGTSIVVDTASWYDPNWKRALAEIAADSGRGAILDCVAHAPRSALLADVLVGQLSIVRPLLDESPALELVHASVLHYAICGESGDTVVNLVGAASLPGAPPLRLQVASLERRWDVLFADASTAFAAAVTRLDASGSFMLAPIYENSRRSAWRELHAAITDEGPVSYGLGELIADRLWATELLRA